MISTAFKQLKTAILLLVLFTVLTGFIYPLIVTAFAQLLFPWQANGSMLTEQHRVIGSHLIGQSFSDPQFFWSRPSATTLFPYNAASSAGANLALSNPAFLKIISERITILQKNDPLNRSIIPIDLITSSASGLDPDITPAAAFYQVPRVAKARGLSEQVLQQLVTDCIQARTYQFLGEPRVNVLELNLALNVLSKKIATKD